jgi:HEAT repeat protein
VRRRALEALGKLDSEAAILGLLQALEDKNSSVRLSAEEVLGKLGSEAAIPGLLQALEDKNSSVRLSTVEVLGKLGSEAAIPGLLQALEDENSSVRWRAAEALGNFKKDRAAHLLPNILTLIPTESGEDAFRALTAIQANCKFYNYDIFRSPPIPKPETENPSGQTTNIYNIDNLTATHSPLNLGGTIHGNQSSTQNLEP